MMAKLTLTFDNPFVILSGHIMSNLRETSIYTTFDLVQGPWTIEAQNRAEVYEQFMSGAHISDQLHFFESRAAYC